MARELGLYAHCRNCGYSLGTFHDEGVMRAEVAKRKECSNCKLPFSFQNDGEIYNLRWEVIPTPEEYALVLLKEFSTREKQEIFGYDDKGIGISKRYSLAKRINFKNLESTDRASPAVAIIVYDKATDRLEKTYYFDNPAALLQIADEALKGYYWLKYGRKP